MADLLSQSEIDALLSALSSGDLQSDDPEAGKSDGPRRVRPYDFKRAMRFSKDQLRSLMRIYEKHARLLTTYFSSQLRTLVEINVITVEQVPYEEFVNSIPQSTVLPILDVPPLEGKWILEISPNIIYVMLDRLLGGPGIVVEQKRELTEIETALIHRILSRSLSALREAWDGVFRLDPQIGIIEFNPQFLQLMSVNETVAVVSFSIRIGEVSGTINLCMPHVGLEPVLPALTTQNLLGMSQRRRSLSAEDAEALRRRLQSAYVDVAAVLGNAMITVEDLLNLEEGDVIPLYTAVGEKISVRVGNHVKFLGQPGVYRGKTAVQITDVLEEKGADEE